MSNRDSFIFYRSFFEAIADVGPEDQAAVFRAICEYALNGKQIRIKGVSSAIFKLIRPQLDANQKRYENGKGGGRPRKINENRETETKPNRNQTETKPKPNVNVNENVNDNGVVVVNNNSDILGDKTKPKPSDNTQHTHNTHPTPIDVPPGTVPTMEQLRLRCVELKATTDLDAFVKYNVDRGWKKPWPEALDAWLEHDRPMTAKERIAKKAYFEAERDTDYDQIQRDLIRDQMAEHKEAAT